MHNERIRRLSLGGMLAALVFVLTYAIKLPVPVTGGYIHPGDGAIFFAGVLLGPYAALVGGLGSALSDLLGGYFVYIAPTFIIKAIMGGMAGLLCKRGAHLLNGLVFILSGAVMVLGYYLFEGFTYGWEAALGAVVPNLIQAGAGVVIGLLLSALPISPTGT